MDTPLFNIHVHVHCAYIHVHVYTLKVALTCNRKVKLSEFDTVSVRHMEFVLNL